MTGTARASLTRPTRLRVEASSACNLRCPSCPTTTGHIHPAVGTGLLAVGDFRRLLDENPWVEEVELSNWGDARQGDAARGASPRSGRPVRDLQQIP